MIEQLKESYGFLFEEELITEITKVGLTKSLKRGETLMEIGSSIRYMPLLFKGSIKVVREDSDGNELLLYFLETGDTCAFSLSCCIGNKKSEIKINNFHNYFNFISLTFF